MSKYKEVNILSLFDGIGCGRVALDRIGVPVKKYYASEIEASSTKVVTHHYPDAIHLGDVTKWEEWNIDWSEIDVLFAGFPCFAEDTLCLTSTVYKKIIDIKIDDYVLTHNNRYKKVVETMLKTSDHINRVKIQGNPIIEVTDEHPFYVSEMYRTFSNTKRAYVRNLSKPVWKNVIDLTKTDMVGIPINNNDIIPVYKDLNIDLTNKYLWKYIGRWLVNGWISTSTNNLYSCVEQVTILCCSKQEELEVEELLNHIPYNYTKVEDITTFKYIISDKNLWNFIQIFGRDDDSKFIPPNIIDSPKLYLEYLLDGYNDGHGHRHGHIISDKNNLTYKATSISLKLLLGIQSIIAKVYGTYGNIHMIKSPEKKIIEGRVVNPQNYYVISYHKEYRKQSNYMVDSGFIWTPFKSIERIEKNIDVYNFEVEEDNSYSVNNLIVHNCQSWSLAGKQKGIEDPRGQLVYSMIGILDKIREYNPDVKFLFENVKMKPEYLDFLNETIGTLPIRMNSSLLSAGLRDRYYWTNIEGVEQPEDKDITLQSILVSGKTDRKKSLCITKRYEGFSGSQSYLRRRYFGKSMGQAVFEDCMPEYQKELWKTDDRKEYTDQIGYIRSLKTIEAERIQTLDDGYVESVLGDNMKAKGIIGNGWTVDIIAHFLKNLPKN